MLTMIMLICAIMAFFFAYDAMEHHSRKSNLKTDFQEEIPTIPDFRWANGMRRPWRK